MIEKLWDKAVSYSPDDTLKFGEQFAENISPGDVYSLTGELAAGKTTFLKGVIKNLGYQGTVTSPTFTLINEYTGIQKIIHIDCYREQNLSRWMDIGILEYFNNENIVFIEWPEILSNILPKKTVNISIRLISQYTREIEIVS